MALFVFRVQRSCLAAFRTTGGLSPCWPASRAGRDGPCQQCLCLELAQAGIPHQSQVNLPALYKNLRIDTGFRADILVAGEVILELKSVEHLAPIHEAQLLTYLRMSGYRIGLLMNFNTLRLKDGLRRCVMSGRSDLRPGCAPPVLRL